MQSRRKNVVMRRLAMAGSAEGKNVPSLMVVSRRDGQEAWSESTIRPRREVSRVQSPVVKLLRQMRGGNDEKRGRRAAEREREDLMIESQEEKSKKSSRTAGLLVLFKKGQEVGMRRERFLSLRPKEDHLDM